MLTRHLLRHIPGVALLASCLLHASPSHADGTAPAAHYAQGSVSFGLGPAADAWAAPSLGTPLFVQWIGVAPRFILHHVAIQPAASVGTESENGETALLMRGGVAMGYAAALSSRIAITPMLGVDVTYGLFVAPSFQPSSGGWLARPHVELPVTIFVNRTWFIEPYADVGALLFLGSEGPPGITVGGGVRVGTTF